MSYYKSISFKEIVASDSSSQKIGNHWKLLSGTSPSDQALENLSKINIFIGKNNSGKSRLLRALFESNKLKSSLPDEIIGAIQNGIKELDDIYSTLNKTYFTHDNQEQYKYFISLKQYILGYHFHNDSLNIFDIPDIMRIKITYSPMVFRQDRALNTKVHDIVTKLKYEFESFKTAHLKYSLFYNSIYIPVLRTLRKFDDEILFFNRTMNEYFKSNQTIEDTSKEKISNGLNHIKKYNIFNGTTIHKDLSNRLLNSSAQRRKVLEYEDFLSRNFFNDQEIQLSPNNDGTVHIKIGEDIDRPLHLLGDGMQSLIILTYPAYFTEEQARIHVEEPELYLHPGLQRQLIEVINKEPLLFRHQWFMTSHSNFFLDLTLEYSNMAIFHFNRREEIFEINRLSSPSLNLLRDLGINATSIFRTNSIIWVDGVTDRLYIKEFLNLYIKTNDKDFKPKEDIDYSIVEYGGNNFTHFNFLNDEEHKEKINIKFICGNSMVILDGDNLEKPARKVILEKIPLEQIHILPKKEIENILPIDIIVKTALYKLERSTNDYSEQVSMLNDPKIIRKLKTKIQKQPLGKSLDEILGISYFSDSSGTIKDKVNFCTIAINFMKEPIALDDSDDIMQLSISVYNFIQKSRH